MDLLLQVEDRFVLGGHELALAPDLSQPHSEDGAEYAILVERPDGSSIAATAKLRLVHFRPVGYRLLLCLTGIDKDEIPVGSNIWKV